MNISRLSVIVSIAALSALALTGCTSIKEGLQNESSSKFDSTAELVAGWDKTAPWLPSDSVGIRIKETANGDPAVLRATSASQLDPSLCVETERRSAAIFTEEWSADSYVETVLACGDWAVVPTDDGWYGWTPNHPDEKAASLEASAQ